VRTSSKTERSSRGFSPRAENDLEGGVAAHGGGAAPSGSDDGDGLLWCTSSSKKTSGGFTAGSSTSSQPAITASGSGKWCVTAVARVQCIAEQNPNDLGLYL
jgi:hypothetical protein